MKEVARGEVAHVAEEAKYQTRNLVDQTRYELRGQVRNQQSNLASKLNGWASELGSMASKSDESGPMTDLAQEASSRVGEFSHWLDNHEPADLLDEVKRFARRRPGTFLALAAVAGVVAGRLTRGAVAGNTSVGSDTDVAPARAYDSDIYDRGGYGGDVAGQRLWGAGLRERLRPALRRGRGRDQLPGWRHAGPWAGISNRRHSGSETGCRWYDGFG